MNPDGHYKVIGNYTSNDTLLGIQLYPPITRKQENFIEDVSKYYNLDSVVFLTIYGVPGICIMADNDIWLIDGNKRMDLKSYIKDEYPNYPAYRYDFLIKEEYWLSPNINWR